MKVLTNNSASLTAKSPLFLFFLPPHNPSSLTETQTEYEKKGEAEESTQEEEEGVRQGGGEAICVAERQHGGDTSVSVLTFSSVGPGCQRKPLGPNSSHPEAQMEEQSHPKISPAHSPTSSLYLSTNIHPT